MTDKSKPVVLEKYGWKSRFDSNFNNCFHAESSRGFTTTIHEKKGPR